MQAKTDGMVASEADMRKSKDDGGPGTMQSEETTLAETEHKAQYRVSKPTR